MLCEVQSKQKMSYSCYVAAASAIALLYSTNYSAVLKADIEKKFDTQHTLGIPYNQAVGAFHSTHCYLSWALLAKRVDQAGFLRHDRPTTIATIRNIRSIECFIVHCFVLCECNIDFADHREMISVGAKMAFRCRQTNGLDTRNEHNRSATIYYSIKRIYC